MDASKPRRIHARLLWALATLVVVSASAWIATPALLIQPFKPQTPFGVAVAYELRSKAPLVTLVGLVLALVLLAFLSRRISRWWQWPPLVALALVAGFSAWFARQNHFEWMFNPLPDPTYAPATLVTFVGDRDMVVAVEIHGDAVAFPVLQMAYHHIVPATVGGVPVVSTY
jgi:hypothetical protein